MMKAANKLVNVSLFLLLLYIAGSAAFIAFVPATFIMITPAIFLFYIVLFFAFSRLLASALKEANLWNAKGRVLSPFAAGWQMLWYAGPSRSLKRKIWLMHFLPIIAFFVLAAEGVVLHFLL